MLIQNFLIWINRKKKSNTTRKPKFFFSILVTLGKPRAAATFSALGTPKSVYMAEKLNPNRGPDEV